MGPYCNYCQRRCFLLRTLRDGRQVLLATCEAGMKHDRQAVGEDHRTALNPVTGTRDIVPPNPGDRVVYTGPARGPEWERRRTTPTMAVAFNPQTGQVQVFDPEWSTIDFWLADVGHVKVAEAASYCGCDGDPIECNHQAARGQAEEDVTRLRSVIAWMVDAAAGLGDQAIAMYVENRTVHGHGADKARAAAVGDIQEGLESFLHTARAEAEHSEGPAAVERRRIVRMALVRAGRIDRSWVDPAGAAATAAALRGFAHDLDHGAAPGEPPACEDSTIDHLTEWLQEKGFPR